MKEDYLLFEMANFYGSDLYLSGLSENGEADILAYDDSMIQDEDQSKQTSEVIISVYPEICFILCCFEKVLLVYDSVQKVYCMQKIRIACIFIFEHWNLRNLFDSWKEELFDLYHIRII